MQTVPVELGERGYPIVITRGDGGLSAFLAERARPWVVCGPVLARAFARLALILRSLVKPRFFLWLASSRSL